MFVFLLLVVLALLLVLLVFAVRGSLILQRVHDGVETVNGTLLGEYADLDDARRVLAKPEEERTQSERHLLDKLERKRKRD